MDKQLEKKEALALLQELEEATLSLDQQIIEAERVMAIGRNEMVVLNAGPVRQFLRFLATPFRKR